MQNINSPEPASVNIVHVLRLIWNDRIILLSCVIFCSSVAVIIAFTSTPVYRAEATLISDSGNTSSGGVASLVGQFGLVGGGNAGSVMAETRAILLSRVFAAKFVEEQDMEAYLLGAPSNTESVAAGEIAPKELNAQWAIYKAYRSILDIGEDASSGLITISVEWTEPTLASEWANAIVVSINEHMKAQDIAEAEKSLEFLSDQLGKTNIVEVQQALYELVETQTKTIMLANVRDEYIFKVIDPAIPPESKVRPNRRLIMSLGLFLGILFGLAAIYFRTAYLSSRKA